MQVIRIEAELDAPLHCPVCGQNVIDQEDDPTCPHILFTHFDGFGYVKPSIEKLKDEAEAEEEDSDEYLPEILIQKINIPTAACFVVSSSGMACGPVTYTNYVAIDFEGFFED